MNQAMVDAARGAEGKLKEVESAFFRLARAVAQATEGDEVAMQRARLYARRVEQLIGDVEEHLSPVCHNCDREVAFGVSCCGGCFHAGEDDGTSSWRCPLAPIDVAEVRDAAE